MYAVIVSGGSQYPVKEGDSIKVEKLTGEVGDTITFDKVLFVKDGENSKVGAPYVEGCKVTATLERHGRGKKVKILKFKRRKHQMKRQGHRQDFTEVKISKISEA